MYYVFKEHEVRLGETLSNLLKRGIISVNNTLEGCSALSRLWTDHPTNYPLQLTLSDGYISSPALDA
jgi:hypothetical protein